jgi:hypothetical protein
VAVMTESDAPPIPRPDVPDDPRRLVLAYLVTRLAAGLAGQVVAYEAAAAKAGDALRQALTGLAQASRAQAAELAPLARALGVAAAPPPPSPLESVTSWGTMLGEAFQAERTLEWGSRELAGLAPDSTTRALASRLAAQAARNAEEVRRLYLRYT